jgi:hypothetical protein
MERMQAIALQTALEESEPDVSQAALLALALRRRFMR